MSLPESGVPIRAEVLLAPGVKTSNAHGGCASARGRQMPLSEVRVHSLTFGAEVCLEEY